MYRCEYCNASFPTFFSLRSHKNARMKEGIPHCARVDSGTICVSADDSENKSFLNVGSQIQGIRNSLNSLLTFNTFFGRRSSPGVT